ncbi:ATP-binding protein [Lysinibacillus sp. fkY74-1]|uniref:histidine kinase n=3 Tax=Lysinibacillus TaxID=400634 RepID=W7S2B7_LYSSH|nr:MULTISPECIES: HAMP domain-containing sensor histidine kinase [Lysinibacillus]MBE5082172.1 HAMP domain-containing protein [Bacillus thuringiensis]AMO34150.1 two-component sensor histidine kinase [Lysinibacillus sphaericus]AMR90737.1 two-component sensor histidine kinase [Lysinibacillus sphaericus]ANA44787.1 two-component sensor histidine kinase [Lysinibacillus sphaericus]EWH33790.1 histidine kinase [Lysinibacillus sphaericus CBAM5]
MNRIVNILKMKKITYKLFMITSLILLSFAVLIYLTLYFFLPTFYEQYKTNQLQSGITEIIDKSKNLTLKEAKELLDEYSLENNAIIYLQEKNGHILYSPSFNFQGNTQSPTITGKASSPTQNEDTVNAFNQSLPIQFLNGHHLIVTVFATFQPIDEASQVLVRFLPYISIIVVCISLGSAYLYSRFITKPLLYINERAQKMANLDFSENIIVRSNDELEELSNSLNEMSNNLQKTMNDLRIANEQLKDDIERERKVETKRREFFATVAHELKTPLTVMKGYIEGMIYNIGPYENRDFYLEKNHKIIERMEQLVREILSMSQLEQHIFKIQMKETNLSDLIETITKDLVFFASQKDITIINKIPPNLYVFTENVLLEKAFKNIIHNAIMYSPQGETVYLGLTKDSKENQIQIQVMNTGVQIKAEELQQLFQPFYRIEKSRNRNTGGSGLGLYIVKQIFISLSIHYSVNNVENGIQFLVTFPKSK